MIEMIMKPSAQNISHRFRQITTPPLRLRIRSITNNTKIRRVMMMMVVVVRRRYGTTRRIQVRIP